MVALEAAYVCRDGVARSLWRNVVKEDACAALVDWLCWIATLEGEERARSACGTGSQFGRAA